ncbi:winged helix-turn-helix transcriptional regulator [Rhodococcus sp. NPDC058514]|uniref:winged helix-turn-helix transcriptional regulator n=1 Tax=unclassified Rhodococcus (in: high G+C Gram-positive bacteria) TaxID=192944 RepID=UPI00365CFA91
MARRTYQQFCGLAYALDAVGERWTLLIVRELMAGPRRYSDLAEALTGIGTSLLATRLKQLESDGAVRRALLKTPSVAVIYELTESGRALGRAIEPLATWGARYLMGERAANEVFRVDWALAFIAEEMEANLPEELRVAYDFLVDDSAARLLLDSGRTQVTAVPTQGQAADVVIRCGAHVLAAIVGGRLDIADAMRADQVQVEGEPIAAKSLLSLIQSR